MNFSKRYKLLAAHCLVFGSCYVAVLFPVSAKANLALGSFTTEGAVNITTGRLAFVNNSFLPVPGSEKDGFPAVSGGTIKNITFASYPVDTTFLTPDFMTFTGLSNISFTMTELLSGFDPAATCFVPAHAGQICTPPNSPYNLQNTGGGTSNANFTIIGTEVDSITGKTAAFTGTFSTTFPRSYQANLATVLGGGTLNTSYSGSFIVVATPEPGFLIPLLGGMTALWGYRRRYGRCCI